MEAQLCLSAQHLAAALHPLLTPTVAVTLAGMRGYLRDRAIRGALFCLAFSAISWLPQVIDGQPLTLGGLIMKATAHAAILLILFDRVRTVARDRS